MKRNAKLPFPPANTGAESSAPSLRLSRRAMLVAIPAMTTSGCIGSFALTNKLLDWNRGLGNKWVAWLVMCVLFLIPVYPIVFGLVDLWVINSIEFWTGSAPFAKKDLPDGGQVITERTEDPNVARLQHLDAEGKVLSETYIRRESDKEMTLLDSEGRAIARAREGGSIEMLTDKGQRVTRMSPAAIRRIQRAVEAGQSPSEVAWQILEEQGDDLPMLAFSEACQSRVLI